MSGHPGEHRAAGLEHGFRLQMLTIDPPTGEIVGPAGRERVDPKVMAVMRLLAEHAGELVTREQLLQAIWPSVAVTDDAVSRCIYHLRQHLCRASGDSRYKAVIETLPKRGYRLNADVEPLTARAPPVERGTTVGGPRITPPQPRRWLLSATLLAVAAAVTAGWRHSVPEHGAPAAVIEQLASVPPTIAVLPFADLSPAGDQQFFSDGLAEEILNVLAQSQDLRVIARSSSFAFRGGDTDLASIADALNVTHVLEGSVRMAGDRVRITAQLIEAANSTHLWSNTYDREPDDLIAVQDEIATAVADALHATLGKPLGKSRHVPPPRAYERALQARFFYDRRGPGDLERAEEYFKQALEIDPRYARAWSGLAAIHGIRRDESSAAASHASLQKMGEAVERALALDPDDGEVQLRAARYFRASGNLERARQHWRRAEELNPHDPLLLGMIAGEALRDGRAEDALAIQRRAVALNPLAAVYRANLAQMLIATGRYEEAIAELHETRLLSPALAIDYDLAFIAVAQGHYGEAFEMATDWSAGWQRDHILALAGPAVGRAEEAQAGLEALRASTDPERLFRLVEVHSLRGEHDEAFSLLEAAYRAAFDRAPGAIVDLQFAANISPLVATLRADERWRPWLDRLEMASAKVPLLARSKHAPARSESR